MITYEEQKTMVIWKYQLDSEFQSNFLDLPDNSKILTIQLQDQIPTVWVLVDPKELLIPVRITPYMTGEPIQGQPGEYLGTLQNNGIVVHFFKD